MAESVPLSKMARLTSSGFFINLPRESSETSLTHTLSSLSSSGSLASFRPVSPGYLTSSNAISMSRRSFGETHQMASHREFPIYSYGHVAHRRPPSAPPTRLALAAHVDARWPSIVTGHKGLPLRTVRYSYPWELPARC